MPNVENKFDLGKTIGSIESSVSSIHHTVDKVNNKVDSLNDKLSQLSHTTVRKSECSEGCGKVERKVDSVRVELVNIRQDLAKKQTRREVPIVGALSDDTARYRISSDKVPPLFQVTEEEEKPKRSLLIKAKENAVAITAVIGLVTMIGVGFLKLARFVVRVETVLKENKKVSEAQTQKLKKEIQRIDDHKPRIVYLPAPQDASPRPARRRRLRNRRVPTKTRATGAPTKRHNP